MWHILLDVASINTEEILILFSSVCNIPLIRLGLDESVIHFAICPTAVKFPTDSHIFLQHLMEELDALPARLGCRDFRLLTEPTNLNRANKSAAKKHIMNKACPGAGHVVCCVLLLFFFLFVVVFVVIIIIFIFVIVVNVVILVMRIWKPKTDFI